MFLKKIPIWVVVVALLCPTLSTAKERDEIRNIRVDAFAINVYGHWISEDGEVVLRYSNGVTYADGWQISPALTEVDSRPDLTGSTPDNNGASARRKLVLEVCSLRDSMFAIGEPQENVTAACMELLRASGFVNLAATDSGTARIADGIQHIEGPLYRIYWNNGATSQMNLGRAGTSSDMLSKSMGSREAYELFRALAVHLESGNMYLISTYPIPRGAFIPRAQMSLVAATLQQVSKSSSPISEQTWPHEDVIAFGFAEQIRNPLSADRKEGE